MTGGMPPGDHLPSLLGGDEQWRRLDPRMLLVHPVQEAVRFLPALAAVFVTGRSSDRSPWWDVGALALVVVLGMSRWFTTRYRIWGGQIELRKGVLFRSLLATPADRIRTVDITAPPWHRVLGLAKVQIGTASGGALAAPIVLDALAAPVAQQLRSELLHRSSEPELPGSTPAPDGAALDDPAEHAEVELLRFSPAWIRYAPLTTSGLVSALAIWGFSAQFAGDLAPSIDQAVDVVVGLGVGLAIVLGLLVAVVGVCVLAVTAYILSFWDYRLTRHSGGTLHVRRGLLTVRATSLEEARLRGVEIGEPLGLRMAAAARLVAVTTGLSRVGAQDSSWLTPPAPAQVVTATALRVVADPQAITGALSQHGSAARRRRYVRAVVPALALAALAVGLDRWVGLPLMVLVAAFVPLLTAAWFAADRYAALGHLVTAEHIVARSGSITRRRDVLARRGVVGVVLRESFFQRRAGLATLVLTTAAGRQGYAVPDVPLERAEQLTGLLLPLAVAGLGAAGQVVVADADSTHEG